MGFLPENQKEHALVVINRKEDKTYDKIVKYKKLLDTDAISQEEYDQIKNKILKGEDINEK